MRKSGKEQIILNKIWEKLNFCDKIIMKIFNDYTVKIYKIGFNDAFNWKNQKYGKNSKNKNR